jgi:hypothetical protein
MSYADRFGFVDAQMYFAIRDLEIIIYANEAFGDDQVAHESAMSEIIRNLPAARRQS